MSERNGIGILVLDADGNQLGTMTHTDAKTLAYSKDLDLVLVSKNDNMHVYKIMDHGKWKYSKKKQQHKKAHAVHAKEINFRVNTDPHDIVTKVHHIEKILAKGTDVKVSVNMKGREKGHPDAAKEKLDLILSQITSPVQVQQVKMSPSSAMALVRHLTGKNNASQTISKDC